MVDLFNTWWYDEQARAWEEDPEKRRSKIVDFVVSNFPTPPPPPPAAASPPPSGPHVQSPWPPKPTLLCLFRLITVTSEKPNPPRLDTIILFGEHTPPLRHLTPYPASRAPNPPEHLTPNP